MSDEREERAAKLVFSAMSPPGPWGVLVVLLSTAAFYYLIKLF